MSEDTPGMDAPAVAGRLLVATPALADPNFAHSVVLMLEHGPDGALGVVLNQPSATAAASVLPEWAPLVAEPPVVFVGGPVQAEAILGLVRAPDEGPGVQLVRGQVGLLDLELAPAQIRVALAEVRFFAGYAGWSAGQLEDEIAAGGWFLIDAEDDDVFTSGPDDLWLEVLRRQGGVFRTIPEDPSQN